ncbi:fascin domain-containing protein [Streptomyces arenae]|uniref:fascin domain-containing protein n=1 Tax=Streptomyces arenae TaxID=29301 RepID=UPI0026595338|nr:hypothetical protein [Streptomyces arenae]MCG7207380.1 hypothetical protein [Streptomyces arenae]
MRRPLLDNTRVQPDYNAADPHCQWLQIGDTGKFALYNEGKHKTMAYDGKNAGAVVMENITYPTPDTQQRRSPHRPVHTRSWGKDHQQELTWRYELNRTVRVTANCVPAHITSNGDHRFTTAGAAGTGDESGMLRADVDGIGPREQLNLCLTADYPSDDYALQSAATGLFVSVEVGYTGDQYGMLRARSNRAGPWEIFS